MLLTKILSHREDIAWKEIDEQIILMDLGKNKMVHRLNYLGSFIWKHLNGEKNLGEIVKEICNEYSVSSEVAETDLLEFVKEIESLGVVVGS